MGRHKKTAVVLVDCCFLCLVDATTIGTVKSTPAAKFERKACPAAQKSLFDPFQCGAVLLAEGLRPSVGI